MGNSWECDEWQVCGVKANESRRKGDGDLWWRKGGTPAWTHDTQRVLCIEVTYWTSSDQYERVRVITPNLTDLIPIQTWDLLTLTRHMTLGRENSKLGPIWTFSVRGLLTFVASGLDINGCVLSYFEGTANLHCYTSCTLTTLHCSKVSFLQCCHIKRYYKLFTKMWGMETSVRECAQSVLNCFNTFKSRTAAPLKQFLGHMAAAAAVMPLGLLHMRYTLMHTSTVKVVYAPVVCHNSPATSSSGVRSILGCFAPFKFRACSTGQPTSCHELLFWLSTEAVAFSPRPHPYLPCFAPLSRERLSLHCSPN